MSEYIGRFAPSPSGPLHFGSLVTALFSYLHAKQHNGQWLLRIEDVDVPRSVPNADQQIMNSLRAHGLHWDGEVVYQSQRNALYQHQLAQLLSQCYKCTCTRADIRNMGGAYNGKCRDLNRSAEMAAIRFKHQEPITGFHDELLGMVEVKDPHSLEDFVVKRKDGLFAYHLAVVSDDIDQRVSHIVRGADLLETTTCHLALYRAFSHQAPSYMHLPVICSEAGKKLSKQNHARALDDSLASQNLAKSLDIMGYVLPDKVKSEAPRTIIQWAISNALVKELPRVREMIVPDV